MTDTQQIRKLRAMLPHLDNEERMHVDAITTIHKNRDAIKDELKRLEMEK